MITQYGSLDERRFSIYEYDMVNNDQVLIATVYCVRRDNGMWELPAPQIFNKVIYNNNRAQYEAAIQAFRNDCVGSANETSSALFTEIESLKQDNEMIMLAIADLASTISVEGAE